MNKNFYQYHLLACFSLVLSTGSYALQKQLQSLDEQELKVSGEHDTLYQLVLPSGESFPFEEKLLKLSDYFQPMLGREERTIPIMMHIKHAKKVADACSLEDVHELFTMLAKYPGQPEALEKFCSVQSYSLAQLVHSLLVAHYLKSESLYTVILCTLFRKSFKDLYDFASMIDHFSHVRAMITKLPDDIQRDIGPSIISKTEWLQTLISAYHCEEVQPYHTEHERAQGYALKGQLELGDDIERANGVIRIRMANGAWVTLRSEAIRDDMFVLFSPDAKKLIVYDYFSDHTEFDANMQVWDLETATLLGTIPGTALVEGSWSPDSKKLLVDEDELLKLYELTDHELHCVGIIETIPYNNRCAWSSDSTVCALRLGDIGSNTVGIWDIKSQTWPHRIGIGTTAPYEQVVIAGSVYTRGNGALPFALAHDGARLAVGSCQEIVIVDLVHHTEKVIQFADLENYEYFVETIAWSPDDTKLMTIRGGRRLEIWDVTFGMRLCKLVLKDFFTIGSDQDRFVWSSDSEITDYQYRGRRVWSLGTALFQLTLSQIALLQKLQPCQRQKKLIERLATDDLTTLRNLPLVWKKILKRAGFALPEHIMEDLPEHAPITGEQLL